MGMGTRLFRVIAGMVVAAWLVMPFATSPASADLINGDIGVTGQNTFNKAADTITFTNVNNSVTNLDGDFLTTLVPTFTVVMATGDLNYTDLATALAGNPLFTVTDSSGVPNIASLTVVANTFNESINNFLIIEGTGILNLTGFAPTEGTFTLSSNSAGQAINFSATAASAPGPVVGAGLPGLLAACLGLVALSRRRRRAAIA